MGKPKGSESLMAYVTTAAQIAACAQTVGLFWPPSIPALAMPLRAGDAPAGRAEVPTAHLPQLLGQL